ncbi:hypothetical protein [Pseudomonas tohonis]|uniref:hypothetical protein n=1 Tax=Pseudomonas tohonis TaxID=2725477 RepID=UPI001F308050|nr:hypothetical protein [Pseudomonas tohonis]
MVSLTDMSQFNVRIRLQRAGIVLGSAYIEVCLQYAETETGDKKRIMFSEGLLPNQSLRRLKPYTKSIFWSSEALTARACMNVVAADVRDWKKGSNMRQATKARS